MHKIIGPNNRPHYPYSAEEAWKKNKNRLRQYDTGKELKSFKIGENVHVQLSKLNAKNGMKLQSQNK